MIALICLHSIYPPTDLLHQVTINLASIKEKVLAGWLAALAAAAQYTAQTLAMNILPFFYGLLLHAGIVE